MSCIQSLGGKSLATKCSSLKLFHLFYTFLLLSYVRYCLKYVNMLRSLGIKPVLVFDGRNLPAKASVEESRRE